MTADRITAAVESLRRLGLGERAEAWRAAAPGETGDHAADGARASRFWALGRDLLARIPGRPARGTAETEAAARLHAAERAVRARFLDAHVENLYERLTGERSRFVRVERLVYEAAALVPGLTPTEAEVAAEARRPQRDKEGWELDQGLLLARVLASPAAGTHLCHAMLLPRVEAQARLAELERHGVVDLGAATVARDGLASHVVLTNPRHLNAEDDTTLDAAEIAVDLALLDPTTQVAVLRGGPVDHRKYGGRRVFGAGINLTRLYWGQVPYVWYLQRELGVVSKLYRGLALPDVTPDELLGDSLEKPWVAVVDAFAIGGHCQYLLAVDYVLAGDDAYLTLPARKEGIIPGAANLRLPRFVGDRIARQAIQSSRRLECASPEGRLICDEVAAPGTLDAALGRVIDSFTTSGVVSAASNRRAFRIAQEPLDLFRRYCALYAREQARCHFSPALIANLEQHWGAQHRAP